MLSISSCHLFLHHHLGLQLHNGVNLSFTARTSVTWSLACRAHFFSFFWDVINLFTQTEIASISASVGFAIKPHISKTWYHALMEIDSLWKNPGIGLNQTSSQWKQKCMKRTVSLWVAGPVSVIGYIKNDLKKCIIQKGSMAKDVATDPRSTVWILLWNQWALLIIIHCIALGRHVF